MQDERAASFEVANDLFFPRIDLGRGAPDVKIERRLALGLGTRLGQLVDVEVAKKDANS